MRAMKKQIFDRPADCERAFAQLADLFGNRISLGIILKTGTDNSWNLDACVDELLKFDPECVDSTNGQRQTRHKEAATDSNESQNKMSAASSQPNSYKSLTQQRPSNTDNFVHPQMHRLINEINQNLRVMIMMRGVPGGGKSFLARQIVDQTMDGDYSNHIFSTDDFFYDARTKQYNYNRSKLSEAHDWNQFRVAQRALNGWSPIIVDNTNVMLWEMFPYVKEGVKNGYAIRLLEPNTPWANSAGQLARRNSHQVDSATISRMLLNYEKATVDDLLRAMHLRPVNKPLIRNFPEIKSRSVDSLATQVPSAPIESGTQQVEAKSGDWKTFEVEQQNFWDAKRQSEEPSGLGDQVSRLQRAGAAINNNNIFELLNEARAEADQRVESAAAEPLVKHAKNCSNENHAFQQIRNIYPDVPISLLWDLFEKCDGDGDWTMDILLKEDFTGGIERLKTAAEIDGDNFPCGCRSSTVGLDLREAVKAIPSELFDDSNRPSTSSGPPLAPKIARKAAKTAQSIESSDVRRLIEEQFVISDDHYSDHVRKIRDFRRNPVASVSRAQVLLEPAVDPVADHADRGDDLKEDEEVVEVDLGINFICQLDSVFGTSAILANNLTDINTTVFLPRSLGQQIYATWIESLYNQIEEQRLKMLKDDEVLAKELQLKQSAAPAATQLFENAHSGHLNDFVDMAYAWSAYKIDGNEWRQTSPESLATRMTKSKLCEIFPSVDKDTLIEVFQANGNNFEKTVEALNYNLGVNVDERIRTEGQSLLNQVNDEVQSVQMNPSAQRNARAPKKKPSNLPTKDINDAKTQALHDFEENRNMAMHHSHLKAECFTKARSAIQKGQHSVAYYYSSVANLHNAKIDMFNNRAANAIVEVHSYNQNNQDMLDLHYLHANEAVECLDIFLDGHIKQLKESKRGFKYVFVITGRGLHSAGGFSTIKARVKNRFRDRQLSWAEVNPGLLKVKLQYISPFAQELTKA